MPKGKYSEQVINSARLAGRTPAQQYRISERKRVDAITTPGAAWAKKKPVPLTPAQIRSRGAAKRREGWLEGTALGRLIESLKPKKKK